MSKADKVIQAARRVFAEKFENIKSANGKEIGVQGDDGEKCFVVHSDAMFALQTALEAYDKRRAELKEIAALGG